MVPTMAHPLPHLLLFLSLLPIFATAQFPGNVTVGASLSAAGNSNSSWLSPSGDFAFGFRSLDNNLFLLSIWYDKVPEKTIVWHANDGKPVEAGSKINLVIDRGLVLRSPQGEELWKSEPVFGVVAYGYMNDTGNFVLKNQESGDLWATFNSPTDTMLPGQVIQKGGGLNSRQRESNFMGGRFRLAFLNTGNVELATLSLPTTHLNEPYYSTQTSSHDTTNPGIRLVFDVLGFAYVVREDGQKAMLSQLRGNSVPSGDYYHRLSLNFDGVLTQYYRRKRNGTENESWYALWSVPDNICMASRVATGSGTCGFNSICRLDTNQRPNCECPPGYTLLDPNDRYGSCKPNFTLGCEAGFQAQDGSDYEMAELLNADWPISNYDLLEPYGLEDCRNSCLNDCMCAVSIFRGGSCWKKKLPLANGRVDSAEPSTAFVKVGKPNSPPRNSLPRIPDSKRIKKQDTQIKVGSVLLGSSFFVNFVSICVGFLCLFYRKNRIPRIGTVGDTNLRCFTYKELKEATGGFREELGRGAFGVVYKGEMKTSSGNNLVAVKKLDRMVQDLHGDKEFKAEMNAIGRTYHKNLVRLLGYCHEGPPHHKLHKNLVRLLGYSHEGPPHHRLLVYEYLSNGTLGSFLFEDSKPSWKQRASIALGVARGLVYLHEECSTHIIHCDIKPQNILLDDYYNPRISNFGLAILLMIGQSHTKAAIRGTKGYVAPEWFGNMPITVKVDVYSFGVLLLEIICCRKSVDHEMTGEAAVLMDWAFDCYAEGTIGVLVKDDVEAANDERRVERFVMVALWCIQEDLSLRPTMRKVAQMLEGVVEVSKPPCKQQVIGEGSEGYQSRSGHA